MTEEWGGKLGMEEIVSFYRLGPERKAGEDVWEINSIVKGVRLKWRCLYGYQSVRHVNHYNCIPAKRHERYVRFGARMRQWLNLPTSISCQLSNHFKLPKWWLHILIPYNQYYLLLLCEYGQIRWRLGYREGALRSVSFQFHVSQYLSRTCILDLNSKRLSNMAINVN